MPLGVPRQRVETTAVSAVQAQEELSMRLEACPPIPEVLMEMSAVQARVVRHHQREVLPRRPAAVRTVPSQRAALRLPAARRQAVVRRRQVELPQRAAPNLRVERLQLEARRQQVARRQPAAARATALVTPAHRRPLGRAIAPRRPPRRALRALGQREVRRTTRAAQR